MISVRLSRSAEASPGYSGLAEIPPRYSPGYSGLAEILAEMLAGVLRPRRARLPGCSVAAPLQSAAADAETTGPRPASPPQAAACDGRRA